MRTFLESCFTGLQCAAPQRMLSRAAGTLADCDNHWIKEALIRTFIRIYGVDMTEAEQRDAGAYRSFNEFFTRGLAPGARPLDPDPRVVLCPADGTVCEIGEVADGRLLQAKGQYYALEDLLGGAPERARGFADGCFATIYLAPRNYHRVHMPIGGRLREAVYLPGRLFSVNPVTARRVPRLFARNERMVALFDTALGPMAVVMVGAMLVSGIEVVWADARTRARETSIVRSFAGAKLCLERGAELGRFRFGSTVIVAFPANAVRWSETLAAGSPVRMGQAIGTTSQRVDGDASRSDEPQRGAGRGSPA
jgi:phosphatidylserine decarboxylase